LIDLVLLAVNVGLNGLDRICDDVRDWRWLGVSYIPMGFAIAKRVVAVVRREPLHDFAKTRVKRGEPMLLRAPKCQFPWRMWLASVVIGIPEAAR
jgi:hypothetical protein